MKPILFGSVCSGIEAASVAWDPLGWHAAWLSEIEPFPSAVLAHHYPDVPNLGDMTTLPRRILSGEVEAPDVFCGGTPCQAFSVAGLRKSLDDARGNLSLTFCEIANAIDNIRVSRGDEECIVFWENVPGVLSTKDNAFGCFLAELAGESVPLNPPGGKWANAGYVSGPKRAVAWRTLDAQYFGVAQRRRRVFVVASARAGFDPAEILFEFDGVRRDSAPSREAGQETAGTLASRTDGGGFPRTEEACSGYVQPVSTHGMVAFGEYSDDGTASAMKARDYKDATDLIAYGIPGNWIGRKPENGGNAVEPMHDIAPCLTKAEQHGVAHPVAFVQNSRDEVRLMGGDGSLVGALAAETGAKQQCYVAFHPTQDPISSTDGSTHGLGCGSSGGQASVAGACFKGGQGSAAGGIGYDEHVAPTLSAADSGSNRTPTLMQNMQVRRLTPTEWERLQCFPDGYTAIPWRNKPASECPDGPRYKALGNSWAVPVVRWIGRRIDAQIRAFNGAKTEPLEV